jgi:hypothetical protein
MTKEPSFKKLVKRFLKYRLYIKHHFRHLPTTQSVAIKYMTDGLAFSVLTVFPGIAKKTPTTLFPLSFPKVVVFLRSLLREFLWKKKSSIDAVALRVRRAPLAKELFWKKGSGDEMHGVFSNLSSETSRGTLFFCVFIA